VTRKRCSNFPAISQNTDLRTAILPNPSLIEQNVQDQHTHLYMRTATLHEISRVNGRNVAIVPSKCGRFGTAGYSVDICVI